jgi:PadR family transcriptional regulator PadR
MVTRPKVTAAVARVLSCFCADPAADRYGMDLMHDSGLASGTLYPILARLVKAGWLTAAWEDIDPEAAGRPARRYYRLTPDGLAIARTELAALHQQLGRAVSPLIPGPASPAPTVAGQEAT